MAPRSEDGGCARRSEKGAASQVTVTKNVFVLMPFDDEFEDVYLVTRDAASEASRFLGLQIRCLRADEIASPGRITEQIMREIESSDLLIADLSGSNPNVMYELGYGHALRKAAIIMNRDVHDSPFDVKDFRQILYDRNRLVKDCRPSLVAAIRDVFGDATEEMPEEPVPGQLPEGRKGTSDSPASATTPLRPGDHLVAALQSLHLRLQYANARSATDEARSLAEEVRVLLSRVTVASGADKVDMDNTAAVAGNCAVEMERGELSDDAETVYRRTLGLFPDYGGLHLQYSDFLLDAGRHEEARQELSRAKSLHRDDYDMRRIQRIEMKLALKTGTGSDELATSLKDHFERNPGDSNAASTYLLYLDRSEAPLWEFEQVCTRWKEAVAPNEQWVPDRALADHLAGKRDEENSKRAVGIYESLLQSPELTDSDRCPILHNLAQLHARAGNRARCKSCWVEAYRINPNDRAIRAVFSQRLSAWGEIEAAMAVAEGKPLPVERH